MNIYKQLTDVSVIGIHVKGFPAGIKEAFDQLAKNLGTERDYYGISWMDEKNRIVYYAMARELFPGEATPYTYERMIIEKGDYKTEPVNDWMSKTDSIKDVLHDLMGSSMATKNHPCIEWYQSDEVMLCMFKWNLEIA